MPREFEYPYTDAFEFTVEVDESGQPYAERTTAGRIASSLVGLVLAAVAGWFLVSSGGPDGRVLSTGVPAVIGLFALVGVVVEALVGSGRSRVIEHRDRYYLKMLACNRWYVLAAGVALIASGVATFLGVYAPDLLGSAGPRPESGLVTLAASVPFGEFVLLFVAVVLGVIALQKATSGQILIVPK